MKKQKPISAAQKAKIRDAIKRHAWNIGVSHYVGDILYMTEDECDDDFCKVASCAVDRRYLRATFKIYPAFFKSWKKEGDPFLERAIAHEVAHIATAHLYDCAIATFVEEGEMKDAWETLTEVVGRLSTKLDAALKK
jgi:hypothetical protein